jgi:acrylyl-CoA reductase (NADPH)
VEIRVTHAALNYKDALAVSGKGRVIRSYPMVPGIDFAGEVVASSSRRFSPGDSVHTAGRGVGEEIWGGYAGMARLPEKLVREVPDDFHAEHMVIQGTAALTAMLCCMAIEQHADAPPEGPVLVTGAGGGVGGFGLALLAGRGYEVWAGSGRPELEEFFRELGADGMVLRQALEKPGRSLEREQWGAVLDTVGGEVLARALAATCSQGVITACGLAGGAEIPATVFPFILRGIRLIGIDSVHCPSEMVEEAWGRLEMEMVPEVIETMHSATIALEEVPAAAEELLAGRIRGRVVVKIG